MADSSIEDLDNLLDSALDDFNKLDLDPSPRGGSETSGKRGDHVQNSASSSAAFSAPVKGLGIGLGRSPLEKSKKKGRQPPKGNQGPLGDASHASEALAMLTQQTQHAFMGLESTLVPQGPQGVEDLEKDGMIEDFVKKFEEMASSQDMDSLVETMIQQLLSKEILHEPMKEIAKKYPKWLEEHSNQLSPEDHNRYHNQYQLILNLNVVYENDPENMPKIFDIMQKMQECGQPPDDLVQELVPDLDFSTLGQLSSAENFGPSSNCSIM